MADSHEQLPSFHETIASKIFHFYIGHEEAFYPIHSARVAFVSPVLRNHISGNMKETAEGKSFLKDVEPGTFEKFAEWTYHLSHVLENPAVAERAGLVVAYNYQLELDNSDGLEHTSKKTRSDVAKRKPEPSRLKKAWSRFLRSSYETAPGWENISIPSFEFASYEANDNLLHAKLYAFGDIYQIEALQVTAVRKIHRNLSTFTPQIKDLVELVRYIYSDTHCPTDMELLRDLVTEYMSCQWGRFGKSELFRDLLKEGGPFVSEVQEKHFNIFH